MGFYIQTPGHSHDKARVLCSEFGAVRIDKPDNFEDVAKENGLLCVVDNGVFEAVGFCFDAREFIDFCNPTDIRPKVWLLMDRKKAEKLSGFAK